MKNLLISLVNKVTNIPNKIYPVGSIYMSVNDTNPQVLFGGTWERIQDRFLLAAGSSYSAGSTGGEASHTLSVEEMPSHEGHLYTNDGAAYGGNYIGYLNVNTMTSYGAGGRGWVLHSGNEMHPAGFSRGGSQSHNNMPPYLTVYIWKRIS